MAIAILWTATGAAGKPGQPAASVDAAGNPFSGGLRFDPAKVTVKVGDTVRWTNTDPFVPHTATEDHLLWNLTGTYGATPANPPGFGPGESRERVFAAGTWSYYCVIHPEEMRGTVTVPVSLRVRKPKKTASSSAAAANGGKRRIVARWATEALPKDQVFQVQARRGSGAWKTVRAATRALRGVFRATPGTKLAVRVRTRVAAEPARASGYSPDASIKAGQPPR